MVAATRGRGDGRSASVELVVGEASDGFGAGTGVETKCSDVSVAAFGLEHHRRRSALRQMRQRRLA